MTVFSVRWAVEVGANECFLFPVHVKKDTPLCILYEGGMFTPPSLWTLIEIIRRLGSDYYPYLRLSWYTSYGAYNVLVSPYTCSRCYGDVIKRLDAFAQYPSEENANFLFRLECECKNVWYKNLANCEKNTAVASISSRVKNGYKLLADVLSLQSLLELDTLAELDECYEPKIPPLSFD